MGIYIVMLACSLFFASIAWKIKCHGQNNFTEQKNYRIFAVLSALPFILVAVIRYRVGTDWPIYEEYFYRINNGTAEFREPLFNLLNKVLYFFSHNSQILFAVVSILIIGFTFTAIYNQSRYAPFSILLFFLLDTYFNSMNQIRQALAMSIFLYASKYIWERKPVKYFLWILVAVGIHSSALIYIPVYFMYGWKANLRVHVITFASVAIGFPLVTKAVLAFIANTRYGWYLDSVYTQDDFFLAGFLISMILLVVFEFYNYTVNKDEDKKLSFMVNMQFLAVVSLLFSAVIPQVTRVSGAFEILIVLTIPTVILQEKHRNPRILLYMGCVGLLTVALLYYVYVCGFYDVVPYQTIFSK